MSLEKICLWVYKTTDVLSLNSMLAFLSKYNFYCFMKDRRVLKFLEPTNRALEHHQPKLENINWLFNFNHILLINGAFHKVLLGGIELEDTMNSKIFTLALPQAWCGICYWNLHSANGNKFQYLSLPFLRLLSLSEMEKGLQSDFKRFSKNSLNSQKPQQISNEWHFQGVLWPH